MKVKPMLSALFILAAMLSICASCSSARPTAKAAEAPAITEPVIRVMSYNILHALPDSPYPWRGRRDAVARLLLDEKADIVGTQELLLNQIEELLKRMPGYAYVGAGRDNGTTGGQFDSAILYRAERFSPVETGNFWLSETPDSPGRKGWDAGNMRTATWVILEEKATRKQIFFINTHLDHLSQTARVEGAKLILAEIAAKSNGLPVVLTGDFNATADNEAIRLVLDRANPAPLRHGRDIAALVEGPMETNLAGGRLIDYVFVSGDITVRRYCIMPFEWEGVQLSDHRAVLAEILAE